MNRRLMTAFIADDGAQGLAEYALIIALVAMVALAGLRILGSKAQNTINNAAGHL